MTCTIVFLDMICHINIFFGHITKKIGQIRIFGAKLELGSKVQNN